jgi:multiple sugar transport system ATP-binding protein
MNFIRGKVDSKGLFTAGDHKLQVPADKFEIVKSNNFQNKEIILGIRPEDIHDEAVVMETYPDAVLDIVVDVAELLGSETNLYTSVNGSNVCASINARAGVRIGDKMKLALDMHKCHFFDPESELRLVLIEGSAPVVKKAPKKETEPKAEQA